MGWVMETRTLLVLIDGCIDSIKLIEHFHLKGKKFLVPSSCFYLNNYLCNTHIRHYFAAPDKFHHHRLKRLMSNWQRSSWQRRLTQRSCNSLDVPLLMISFRRGNSTNVGPNQMKRIISGQSDPLALKSVHPVSQQKWFSENKASSWRQ